MDTLRMLVMAALIFSAFTALTEADDSQFSLRGSDVNSKDTYDRDDYDRKNWDKDKKDDEVLDALEDLRPEEEE